MLLYPNAKINVGLNIIEKRPDGYHNLQTVFYPVDWCDALEFIEAPDGKTEITFSGLPIEGNPSNNLVLKAYRLLQTQARLPELKIHLHKNIPMGAGLGGGSANAAFMLKGLNDFFELKIDEERLLGYASQLGADCAFFIKNTPQSAEGIGNVLSPVKNVLKGYYLVLVKPKVSVSTARAYAEVKPQKPQISLKEVFENEPVRNWREKVVNDFEASVFKLFPEIEQVKTSMYRKGALYASMSGSGSAVYGIFDREVTSGDLDFGYDYWQGVIN